MATASANALTEQEIETFHKVGFLRVNQVFTPEEMDEMDQAFEVAHQMAMELARNAKGDERPHYEVNGTKITYARDEDDAMHVRHISWIGGCSPTLDKYGCDQRLLRLAAPLLGSNRMQQLINQAHYKRPGTGIAFAWHQDATHRGMPRGLFEDVNGHGSYVQIALAIDEATQENGPLSFIPNTGDAGVMGTPLDTTRFDDSTAVAPLLKRGDVALFGPYTVHGSQANMSDKPRRVFINGFAHPDANKRDFGDSPVGRFLSVEG